MNLNDTNTTRFSVPEYVLHQSGVDLYQRWASANSYVEYLRLHELLLSCGVAAMRQVSDIELIEDIMYLSMLALYHGEAYLPSRDEDTSEELSYV